MNHIQERLQERNINIPLTVINNLADHCINDTALILAHLDTAHGDSVSNYCDRGESNGDLVVLIVRNNRPNTIMYRRSSQTNTANQLRVDVLEDISEYLQDYIKGE